MEETLLPKFSLLFTLYVTWRVGSGTRCLLLFSGQICMSFGWFVRFCLSVCLFFLFAFSPYPHLGMVWKISSPAHKVSKLSISITSDDVTSEKEEEMRELYQQFNCEYVNAILEVRLIWHDCTLSFHSYVFYVFYPIWVQIHTSFRSKYTFSSKKMSKLKYSQYRVWMTRKPRKLKGLRELTVKSKKSPGGLCPRTPLEAFPSALGLGNRSLFILHPCLLY